MRYIVCPGWVRSAHDGDRHYVGAGQLARLYQLRPQEWELFRDGYPYPADTVFLHPRFDGCYGQPTPKIHVRFVSGFSGSA